MNVVWTQLLTETPRKRIKWFPAAQPTFETIPLPNIYNLHFKTHKYHGGVIFDEKLMQRFISCKHCHWSFTRKYNCSHESNNKTWSRLCTLC